MPLSCKDWEQRVQAGEGLAWSGAGGSPGPAGLGPALGWWEQVRGGKGAQGEEPPVPRLQWGA